MRPTKRKSRSYWNSWLTDCSLIRLSQDNQLVESARNNQKTGYSLIEVIFAVAILSLVGLAVISLTFTALKLGEVSEVKTQGTELAEDGLAFFGKRFYSITEAALRTELNANYPREIPGCPKVLGPNTCYQVYLDCPVVPLNDPCKFVGSAITNISQAPEVTMGESAQRFIRRLTIRYPQGAKYASVNIEVIWGTGVSRQLSASQRFDAQ